MHGLNEFFNKTFIPDNNKLILIFYQILTVPDLIPQKQFIYWIKLSLQRGIS